MIHYSAISKIITVHYQSAVSYDIICTGMNCAMIRYNSLSECSVYCCNTSHLIPFQHFLGSHVFYSVDYLCSLSESSHIIGYLHEILHYTENSQIELHEPPSCQLSREVRHEQRQRALSWCERLLCGLTASWTKATTQVVCTSGSLILFYSHFALTSLSLPI